MKKLKIYRDRIICLFFSFILLAVLESASRLILPCKDQLGQILSILEQDPILFWRQKKNLDVTFQNTRMKTNALGLRNKDFKLKKDADSLRIVSLGASPTFGWGVNSQDVYTAQLEKILGQIYLDKHIEVINAGVIGYSSYQGLIFLKKEVIKLSPDVITVPFVINELDKYRFYRNNGKSDKELGPKSKILVSFENLLNKSHFFKVFKRIIISKKGMAIQYFGESDNGVYSKKRRVSPEDYKKNLNAIIDIIHQNDIKVMLIKMPVNLPVQKEIVERLWSDANNHMNYAITYIKIGRYNEAASELLKVIKDNPYSSEAFYYLGICSEKQKKFREAKSYFRKARKLEFLQCGRLGKLYNEIMQEVADERKVPLVDIVSTFEAFSKKNDAYLFLDPVHDSIHPNVIGHKIIAMEVKNTLTSHYLQ